MLASSNVGLGQEGEGAVYARELGGLAYLPLVVFVGMFQDGLPNVVCQHLICVGRVCELGSYPGCCDLLVSIYPVIYIPGPLSQGPIDFLDLDHPSIGLIDRVAVQLYELP